MKWWLSVLPKNKTLARTRQADPIMIRACLFQDPLYLYRKSQIVWLIRELDPRSHGMERFSFYPSGGLILSRSLVLSGAGGLRRWPRGRSGLLLKPGLPFR